MTTQIAREETCCHHMGYSFRLAARGPHTTTFVTPEREIAQWVHHEGSIRWPIAIPHFVFKVPIKIFCFLEKDKWRTDSKITPIIIIVSYLVIFCVGSNNRSFMVDPLSYFSFQPVLHDWYKQRPWYVLLCLWDDTYKRTLAANQKE